MHKATTSYSAKYRQRALPRMQNAYNLYIIFAHKCSLNFVRFARNSVITKENSSSLIARPNMSEGRTAVTYQPSKRMHDRPV